MEKKTITKIDAKIYTPHLVNTSLEINTMEVLLKSLRYMNNKIVLSS